MTNLTRPEIREKRDRTRAEVNQYLKDYLESKGINTNKKFNCLNPQHADSDPSMSYDKKRNIVYCFGCGTKYDIFDLIGIFEGIHDHNEQLRRGCELYGIQCPSGGSFDTGGTKKADPPTRADQRGDKQVSNNTVDSLPTSDNNIGAKPPEAEGNKAYHEFITLAAANLKETDYLRGRGISDETAARYQIGYCPNWKHPNSPSMHPSARLIIPTGTKDETSYVARAIDPNVDKEYRFMKYGEVKLFNEQALDNGKPVYIVEGEIDALSIAEAGGEAVAIGGTSGWSQLLDKVKGRAGTLPVLILALDNDKAGDEASGKLAEGLKESRIKFDIYRPYWSNKDANEALQADRELFTRYVKWGADNAGGIREAEEYKKSSAYHYITAFIGEVADRANSASVSTGFTALDERLDGGLHPELIIMGAISSLGKTTLMLQIADQIASQGKDVLYFSLEMSRYELMAKSISRHTMSIGHRDGISPNNWKTNRGITSGERYANYNQVERKLINDAIKEYEAYSKHLYINEGLGNITAKRIVEQVEAHERALGTLPAAVFVDYLQILAPADPRSSDKQNTDRAVFELKRLSRDKNIPIFAIASFNRENYKDGVKKVSMTDFKESGAIEYTSDLLLGLQFKGAGKGFSLDDLERAMNDNPRELELHILKNRNGSRGLPVSFEYYPQFNTFRESASPEVNEYGHYNGY